MILDRTFWPVGHGAFYTERFYNHFEGRSFTAVYDCGGKDENVVLQNINNMIRVAGKKIDVLFISHLHRDHINGFDYLKSRTSIKHIILPYLTKSAIAEAYIYNAINGIKNGHCDTESPLQQFVFNLGNNENTDDNITFVQSGEETRFIEDIRELPDIDHIGKNIISGYPIKVSIDIDGHEPYWVFIPVNVRYDETKSNSLLDKINLITHFANIKSARGIDWQKLQNAFQSANKKEIGAVKKVYKEIFNGNHNAYSMPVYSGPFYYLHPHYWDVYRYRDSYVQQWMSDKFHPKSLHFRREKYDTDFYPANMLPCLYMGDFEASDEIKLLELQRFLGRYYDIVGMQQIPHHFSLNNHNIELYKNRVCAFGSVNNHGDISFTQSVCREIGIYAPTLIITEEKDAKFCCHFELW